MSSICLDLAYSIQPCKVELKAVGACFLGLGFMPPVSSEKTCSQGGEPTQISAEKVGKSVQLFLGKLGLPYSHANTLNGEHFLKICIPSYRRSRSHSSLNCYGVFQDPGIYLVRIPTGIFDNPIFIVFPGYTLLDLKISIRPMILISFLFI